MFVVVNLILLAIGAVVTALMYFAVTRPVWPYVAAYTLIFAVIFNGLTVWKIKQNGKRRSPACPACGLGDVSFGGAVAEVMLQTSGLAKKLSVLNLFGEVILISAILWLFFVSPPLAPPNVYVWTAIVVFVAIRFLSHRLSSRHRKRTHERDDGRIRWVCEACRNIWYGDELAEGDEEARAPSHGKPL